MYPYRRFALVLTNDGARLGASAVRYSFTVGLFHSFQLAGFDRRTGFRDTTGWRGTGIVVASLGQLREGEDGRHLGGRYRLHLLRDSLLKLRVV